MDVISMAKLRQLEGNNFAHWIVILIIFYNTNRSSLSLNFLSKIFYNTNIVEIIMTVYMTT